jgi:tetratricopeptide (TPR) repeat protein
MATLAQVRFRHAEHYLLRLGQLDGQYNDAESRDVALGTFDREWEQITTAQRWVAEDLRDDRRSFLFFSHGRTFLEVRRSLDERLRWLEAAERFAVTLNDPVLNAEYLNFRGNIAYETGDLDSAADLYGRASAVAADAEERAAEAGYIQNLGNVYLQKRNYGAARSCFERALATSRELGDRRGIAVNLGSLAISFDDDGDAARAIELYREAIPIFEELRDWRELETFVGNLGNSYSHAGEHEQAIVCLRRALELARSLGNVRAELVRIGNLGGAYAEAGQIQAALEHCKQALVLARQRGAPPDVATSLARLGSLYATRFAATTAVGYYVEAAAIYDELGMTPQARDMKRNADLAQHASAFAALIQAGNDELSRGNLRGALARFEEALDKAQRRGDESRAAVARVNVAQQRSDESRAAVALGNIALVYLQGENLEAAEEYLARALQLSERGDDASLRARHLALLGNVMEAKGDSGPAFDCYERAYGLWPLTHDLADRVRLMANLARLAFKQGSVEAGRAYYAEALRAARAAGLDALAEDVETRLREVGRAAE